MCQIITSIVDKRQNCDSVWRLTLNLDDSATCIYMTYSKVKKIKNKIELIQTHIKARSVFFSTIFITSIWLVWFPTKNDISS